MQWYDTVISSLIFFGATANSKILFLSLEQISPDLFFIVWGIHYLGVETWGVGEGSQHLMWKPIRYV